uniref:Ovule protein n=1 Tax=Gongylonema pulchrum TaxID=637853 RepID=A0A183DFY9_9BILA
LLVVRMILLYELRKCIGGWLRWMFVARRWLMFVQFRTANSRLIPNISSLPDGMSSFCHFQLQAKSVLSWITLVKECRGFLQNF